MLKKVILCVFVVLFLFSTKVNASVLGIKASEAEILCLAENLYHESKGESRFGVLAVANVTINRVRSGKFANNICGVVKQKNSRGCQFSWVCANKRINDKQRFFDMIRYSEQILNGKIPMNVLSSDVMWYHNKHVSPYWADYGVLAGRIGSHLFYKRVRNR